MCLGKKAKELITPTPQPAPPPLPAPVPTEVSPVVDESKRKREAERLKKGLASTIKTSASGTVGAGPELAVPSVGSVLYPSMGKRKTLG